MNPPVRRIYIDLARKMIRAEGIGWLTRRIRHYLSIQISRIVKRPLCGPVLGTLMVTYRCNFHCMMCDMPMKALEAHRSDLKECDTEWFRRVIREFRQLGTAGIGFTGGEPLLRKDIFELLAETRRLGMITHLNTNGWFLDDDAARSLIAARVDSVNVSVDGALPTTHDRNRNFPGSFERALVGVEKLLHARGSERFPRIKLVTVVSEANIDELSDLFSLADRKGVDCIELIPRQPFTHSLHESSDDREFLSKVEKLTSTLLSERAPVPLENSRRHLHLFRRSFAGEPSPLRCSAGYTSLAVDCYGNVFPCVPWINWGRSVGSLHEQTLSDLWKSSAYQNVRESVAECHDCYLNCQAELNILFGP